jgi:Na+-translocating ferredoxin:NAD+ oxidoreductase RnfD subunit
VFGWRAAGAVATVVVAAVLAAAAWQRVGRRGSRISLLGIAVFSLLLALTLPAHLFSLTPIGSLPHAPWPILPVAGVMLAMMCWVLGGSSRVHPVLLTHLLLVVLFQPQIEPIFVLHPDRVLHGDLLDTPAAEDADLRTPWVARQDQPASEYDALWRVTVAKRLTLFTTGLDRPERTWLSLESLIRDRLPPIEDLMVAGEPGPIGCASAVMLIVGGLFLMYRGITDYRIPLLIVVAALVAFLILPVPVVVAEQGPRWQWLAFRDSAATWAVAVTFANYELLASPLLLMALFMATSPSIRPLSRRWRPTFAIVIGVLCAALQLYVGVSIAPYVALLLAGLLTPAMDRVYHSRG